MGKEGIPTGPDSKVYPSGTYNERIPHPTLELKNTVVWENTALKAPFNFEVGTQSPLGVMLDPSIDPPVDQSALSLRVRERGHGRSADVGGVYFKDTQGRLYRDIDVKGTGAVSNNTGKSVSWGRLMTTNGEVMYGLMSKEDALHDSEMAEVLTALNIRTHRSLAIIELQELVRFNLLTRKGEVESVEQLRREKSLIDDFVPVVQVRAFGTKSRLQDMESVTSFQEFEDALDLVRLETNGEVTDIESYMQWFSTTLAQNIGRMHANGYLHGYLTPHNITLDCRVVDFDSVTKRPDEDKDPVIPEYTSFEEELNAPPPASEFWDAASKDFHKAVETLQRHLQSIAKHYPEQFENFNDDSFIITFEKMYEAENPKALMHLRW
ncbi:MAG: hypothetical protein AB202_03550 [Parcubacteria bacterium C7867-007]|nr:MAG: hypothetical protein AB202_03550 [Parcubacteria bacterium C7867-007]